MKNNFFNKPLSNINLKPSSNSEITSQILYGEKFKILFKKGNWVKIKTNYDNYVGFIKDGKFHKNFNPTNKVFKLKTNIFKKKDNKFFATKNFLYFGSKISIKSKNKRFIEFDKNKWIKKKDIRNINHYEKNFIKILKLFLNTKYLWGGKTSEGIDCSALIQIYFYYNKVFFPRDSKDQMKYCRKKLKKKLDKGDIIFWKGHVGVCLNDMKFIHAYGPKKKVLVMSIIKTLNIIKKTANLNVKKVSNILKY